MDYLNERTFKVIVFFRKIFISFVQYNSQTLHPFLDAHGTNLIKSAKLRLS